MRAAEFPEYWVWHGMKQRCLNPKATSYRNYGGRGISVCDAWKNDFLAFSASVGPRPSAAHSIDRIDNGGNYEPGNVRWATAKEQAANRRPAVGRNKYKDSHEARAAERAAAKKRWHVRASKARHEERMALMHELIVHGNDATRQLAQQYIKDFGEPTHA